MITFQFFIKRIEQKAIKANTHSAIDKLIPAKQPIIGFKITKKIFQT